MRGMRIETLARRQGGVVTWDQALQHGMTPKQIRWRLDRGDWRRIHRGVYLTHTGPVTWRVRAWAALLRCGDGSVLILESAAHVWRLGGEPRTITVGVPSGRHPAAAQGMRPVQRKRLTRGIVDGFPVTHLAQTVIDLADRPGSSLDEVVALAARACQQRTVTEAALVAELRSRKRHRFRRELLLACGEIGEGAESLPEVWFVTRVQRPHGLPVFERQLVAAGGKRTDLRNRRYGVILEVDGQLWHAGDRFHTDRRRDRRAAGRGDVPLRASFLELNTIPCEVAAEIGQVLLQRGWPGPMHPCSPTCPVATLLRAG
jgi:very-short-patch-repair endonuclease